MAAEDAASSSASDISPTSSPRPKTATFTDDVEARQDANAKRVEDQEAFQYWGNMVKPDKCGSDKLNSLLAGIAHYIVSAFRYCMVREALLS
jgi:hypothetical protein